MEVAWLVVMGLCSLILTALGIVAMAFLVRVYHRWLVPQLSAHMHSDIAPADVELGGRDNVTQCYYAAAPRIDRRHRRHGRRQTHIKQTGPGYDYHSEEEEDVDENEDYAEIPVTVCEIQRVLYTHIPGIVWDPNDDRMRRDDEDRVVRKFDNDSLDKFSLIVTALDPKDRHKYRLHRTIEVDARKYRKRWDDIREDMPGMLLLAGVTHGMGGAPIDITLEFDEGGTKSV